MVANLERTTARSIVSVKFEQLLISSGCIMPAVLHFKLTVADDVKCYFL